MKELKSSIKAMLKGIEDTLLLTNFAKTKKRKEFAHSLQISQPILQNNTSSNKIINLQKAAQCFENLIIYPNEVLSFWKVVGKASKKKGYQKGHNLINGVMQNEYGGGLCHLSSMLYYLGLLSGFKVIQRYPHSIDFQGDASRYAPLGSDATVAFGYKDLRLQNNYTFPISFVVEISTSQITVKLLSNEKIEKKDVVFERVYEDEITIKVETFVDNKSLHVDSYKKRT